MDTKPDRGQLNSLPKETILELYLQLLDRFDVLEEQNRELIRQSERLQENMAVLVQQRFGRKTEKSSEVCGQYVLDLENMCVLNEAEVITGNLYTPEPAVEDVVRRHVRPKGKRAADLKDIHTLVVEHTIPDEKLTAIFPDGYKRLPDEVYKELEYVPSAFEVHEHHVAVYAARKGDTIVKADRPKRLLGNSILTPSLGAAVINAKYVNAVPINRISAEFARPDAAISRQVMAGWMIRLAERYLSLIYDEMHDAILQNRLIHCDETPFIVAEDQKTRGPTAKSYMWLYHATGRYGTPPIFLYEYQPTRKADNPRSFLRDYKGVLMTDGYQVYHTLADERPEELRVAGCWSHLKRRYAEIIKASGIKNVHGTIADEANRRIAAIYHLDNMFKEAPDAERLDNRRRSVKPLVDAFFDWVKATEPLVDHSSKTGAALDYSINQERYLRAFLDDPDIPLDNNDAERSIRTFCVGKHAWHVVDSVNGAKASGMIYSVSETAKANGLVPYYYFRYLFEELPKHMEDKSTDFIKELLPWSENLPAECRPKPKTI